jgi:hypothetical protein
VILFALFLVTFFTGLAVGFALGLWHRKMFGFPSGR